MWNGFSFIDSEVVDFYEKDNNIILSLIYVVDKNEMFVNGTVTFTNIKCVNIIPGEITYDAVENIGMYYKEGSVNHFEQQKKDMMWIMLDWCSYAPRDFKRMIYEIYSDNVLWTFEETGLHCSHPRH